MGDVMRFPRAVILYWFVALTVLGLVSILHGECFSDIACQQSETRLLRGLLLGCGLIFPFAVHMMMKRFPEGKD